MFNNKTNRLILIFVAGMFLIIFLIFKNSENSQRDSQATPTPQQIKSSEEQPTKEAPKVEYDYYVNKEVGFLIKYPRLLYLTQTQNKEEYTLFLKFEENRYSDSKGFALGVTKRTVRDEEEFIKKTFIEGGGSISSRTKSSLNELGVDVLNFKDSPDAKDAVSSVGIFSYGNLTFSLSSPPSVFEETLKNIALFGKIKGCEDEEIRNDENLKKYCLGELCLAETAKLSCKSLDVVSIKEGKLFDLSKDGVPDCSWVKDLDSKYQCTPIF